MNKVLYLFVFLFSLFILNNVINAYTEYKIGNKITYNDIDFYVIKNSSSTEDSVTMLKAEPLTVEEVNLYGGVGTDDNHVNMYVTSNKYASYYQKAYDQNGYGGLVYYSSLNCGYNGLELVYDDCITDYEESEIKYVIDRWSQKNVLNGLQNARLLTIDDLIDNLGYSWDIMINDVPALNENVPTWIYNDKFNYWTESKFAKDLWIISRNGDLGYASVGNNYLVVRPVITISKSALGDIDDSEIDNSGSKEVLPDNKDINKETTTKVSVSNTYLKQSIIVILLGFIITCASLVIYYIIKKRKKD